MDAKTQAEIDRIQLETAQLNLDEARESNAERINRKASNARKNKQRQDQLAADVSTRRGMSLKCRHRQGGTPSDPFNGKGATSLNTVKMPDGFTVLIMCGVCRGRWFSPHPRNQATKPRPGESKEQAQDRVEKYNADKETFDRLYEMSKDTLTPEAAQTMDCGTVIQTINTETGMPTYRDRPCDSYA
jgi:hypothetical protein